MYTIAAARPRDIPLLPAIELAAAALLAGHAPASVLAETTSHAELEHAQRRGYLWVALADDVAVGFAHARMLGPGVAHLEEVDVHPDHGRRGLGGRLVNTVCAWAAANGYAWVTLTTFRDVPWNMPFYARLGFEQIPPADLEPALQSVVDDETRRGLDPRRRVAMRRPCVGRHPIHSEESSMTIEHLKNLYDYSYWANKRLADALSRLTTEEFTQHVAGSYGSIRNTMVHMLSAEWGWLERCGGAVRGPALVAADYPTVASLLDRWHEVEAHVRTFLAVLRDDELEREVRFAIGGGLSHSMPVGQLLHHAAIHGVHHRGQVAVRLRALGHAPGNVDILIYYAEHVARRATAE